MFPNFCPIIEIFISMQKKINSGQIKSFFYKLFSTNQITILLVKSENLMCTRVFPEIPCFIERLTVMVREEPMRTPIACVSIVRAIHMSRNRPNLKNSNGCLETMQMITQQHRVHSIQTYTINVTKYLRNYNFISFSNSKFCFFVLIKKVAGLP